MIEAQRLFNEKVAPMCPEELTAPVLHSVLDDPKVKSLPYGAIERSFTAGEPVLLLLGDTIYQSNTETTCTRQLLDAYEQVGQPTVAVHSVDLEDVVHYGIFSGVWENKEETILKLTAISEKPSCEKAKDYLAVSSRKQAENYYAAFGAYVITKDVYD